MTPEVTGAANLVVGTLVLGMLVYRFVNGFQSKTTAAKIRKEDEDNRVERQGILDHRLDRIDQNHERIEKITSETCARVKEQNGRIDKLEGDVGAIKVKIERGRARR